MEEVVLKVSVQGGDKAEQSVKSIKQQLREAKEAAAQATEGTEEYFQAVSRAAEAADKLDDVNKAVKALNPGEKAAAFGQLFNTIAGGFQAVTGLYGLFGAKSDEIEKILLKVQAASALAMGVQSVTEGIKQWDNLKTMIMSTTVVQKANNAATVVASSVMKLFGASVETTSMSFRVLKGAIVATGIGALVVVVGELASAMGMLGSATDDAAEAERNLREEQERSRKESKDWSEQYNKSLIESGGVIGETIKLEKRFLQARGETTDQLIKNDIAFQKSIISQANTVLEVGKMFNDLSAKTKRDANLAIYNATQEIKLLETQLTTFYKEEGKKRQEEFNKRIEDETNYYLERKAQQKKGEELFNKELDIIAQFGVSAEDINNAWQQSQLDDYGEFLSQYAQKQRDFFQKTKDDYLDTVATQDLLDHNRELTDEVMKEFGITLQAVDDGYVAWQQKNKGSYEDYINWLKGNLQHQKDLTLETEQKIQAARLLVAQNTVDGLKSLGEIFIKDQKKLTAFNKVATLAQIAIDTAAAISSLTKNSEGNPLNLVTGGAAAWAQFSSGIVRILANMAQAKKVLFSGEVSAVSGGGGGGGTSISAPQFNSPANNSSFVVPDGTDAMGNKVYVLESDITNAQNTVVTNKKKALLGYSD